MRASAGTNSGPVPEYDTDKLNNSPREEEMMEVLGFFAQRFPQGYFTVEGDSAAPNKVDETTNTEKHSLSFKG